MKMLRCQNCNEGITTLDNGKAQSQENTINANSGAHTLTNDKMIKNSLNKKNAATTNSKRNSKKFLVTRACRIDIMVLI